MQNDKTNKPLILAVETSGRVGSVAIARGEEFLREIVFSAPMRHSAEVFDAIVRLLKDFNYSPKEIEQVYITSGPGSFTGIRIAVTIAKTMAFANNVKVVAVDTLDAIAANADDFVEESGCDVKYVGTILDAKRGQFFTVIFERASKNRRLGWAKIQDDALRTPAEFLEGLDKNKKIWLLGEGLVHYQKLFASDNIGFVDKKFWDARAQKVHKIGWQSAQEGNFDDPLTLVPFYLRGPDVTEKIRG